VYWLGPVLGAVLAACTYEYLYCPDPAAKHCLQRAFCKNPSGSVVATPVGVGYVDVNDDDDEARRFTVKPGSVEQQSERDEEMEMTKQKQQALADVPGEALSSV